LKNGRIPNAGGTLTPIARVALVCFVLSVITAAGVTMLFRWWLGPPDMIDGAVTSYGALFASFFAYLAIWIYWPWKRRPAGG
jgi:hypothetical protein